MRTDQAHDLRRLARQARGAEQPQTGRRLVAVVGGKGGVGTTTVAVNLAAALAARGRPAALVDADPDGPDVAALCRLREGATIADVLAGRRNVAEALAPGPAGLLVLPGAPDYERRAGLSPSACLRLVGQLRRLDPPTGFAVLDLGDRSGELADHVRRTADAVLLVTTPELAAVIDAYAAAKSLLGSPGGPPVRLVVNMASSPEAAHAAHARLERVCRRFLGRSLEMAGQAPLDPAAPAAAAARQPLVLVAPRSPAGAQLHRLAGQLADENAGNRLKPAARMADTKEQSGQPTPC